ncbi:hypothetical protein BX666DRAFT_398836 [Dichotomocladium elegans]|nr:hypothetical protein BX666DRAFT_398836 [Dichotomocladium elegans]
MRLITREEADRAIVEMLAQKNSQIEYLLGSTLAQSDAIREANTEKRLKLENEMMCLQSQLERATRTIEELEHQNEQRRHNRSSLPRTAEASTIDQEMLTTRLNQLQQEHERLLAGNDAAQHRLDQAIKSLHLWQNQIADLETISKMYNDQQDSYHDQLSEIARLAGTIEQYRAVVADVQEHPDTTILSDSDNGTSPVAHDHTKFPAAMPTQADLFSELKRASAAMAGHSSLDDASKLLLYSSPKPASTTTAPSAHNLTEPSFASSPLDPPLAFYQPPLRSTASHTDDRQNVIPSCYSPAVSSSSSTSSLCDAPQSLYSGLSVSPSPSSPASCANKRIVTAVPRLFFKKHTSVTHIPLQIVYKLWTWSRFSLIIFLALVINLWQGPDAILEK